MATPATKDYTPRLDTRSRTSSVRFSSNMRKERKIELKVIKRLRTNSFAKRKGFNKLIACHGRMRDVTREREKRPVSLFEATKLVITLSAALMLSQLPLLFVLFSRTLVYAADTKNLNGNCSQVHNQLEIGTYELIGDCGDTQFCSSSGFCQDKGCRKDEFPLGYSQDATLPPKCPLGQFCPDEGDACQTLLPVGSPCQLNRDGLFDILANYHRS